MPQVEQWIEIAAPPRTIFDLVANHPERMPDWWDAFECQQRVTPPPTRVGSVSRYVYNMMGVKIKGEQQVVAMTESEHIAVKTISGLEAAFEFKFTPCREGESTYLRVRVLYALPGSLLGGLLNCQQIERYNLRSLREGLSALKRMVESEARAG